ncbi:hypothetical protein F4780DRAFT_783294 [Xylariomycetidae sp. FL0641]|nr:hypothetical protein F4780DRAFT_783294 [Xylariomycetidae sp. FL0641]
MVAMPHPVHTAAKAQPVAAAMHNLPRAGVASRMLPVAAVGAVGLGLLTFIKRQLSDRSSTMDKIFAQQNTPEVEAHRKRDLLTDVYGDPRDSVLNLLGWAKWAK